MVTLEEMKGYLRVDFEEDDAFIEGLIVSSTKLCMDIARLDKKTFEKEASNKIAVMYAVAYQYEHREDADHHQLTISIRSLLEGVRRSVF